METMHNIPYTICHRFEPFFLCIVVKVERKQTSNRYVHQHMSLSIFQCRINYLKRSKLDATVVFNAYRIWIDVYQIERNLYEGFFVGFSIGSENHVFIYLYILCSVPCAVHDLCFWLCLQCTKRKTRMKREQQKCATVYTVYGRKALMLYCI